MRWPYKFLAFYGKQESNTHKQQEKTHKETMNSESYSKGDELEEQAYRRNTRKRLIIITLSTIILIMTIIGAIVCTVTPMRSNKSNEIPPPENSSSAESINAICNVTQYPEYCSSSIASLKSSSNNTNEDTEELFKLSMQVAVNELAELSSLPKRLISSKDFANITNNPLVQRAFLNCETLIEDSVDHINQSISSMQVDQGTKILLSASKIDDIRTWLSTAITDQETCLDGIIESTNHTILADEVRYAMRNSTVFTSNSLAIASNLMTILRHFLFPIHRKLLLKIESNNHDSEFDDDFPRWVHGGERRLIKEENLRPDLTVAKDGSGDFMNIGEAVDSIPKKSMSRFVIYVKEGVYLENVKVDNDCWNVMMYGDGMNKTIVSGSLNWVDGIPTFSSGTFIAVGKGFIVRDMGFRNTAGPEKEQAVAVRSSSDQSVFYRCSFDGYQDTLYTYSNRQFYRDCHIIGTIDFIFGNAAVVLQNCTIQPRKPRPGQYNTITAQSKTDRNQNTGISIQRCQITPFDNLTATITYLGRPWKDYATSVFMESYIDGFVDHTGWAQWMVNVDPPSTIFYAEYKNIGPGSVVDQRVNWPGVRPNITAEEAERFTVESFIHGSQWLPKANVMYDGTL